MFRLALSAVFVSCLLAPTSALSQTSSLARLVNGRIEYGLYANQGQTNVVNKLPDFSRAGYNGGGVPLPFVAAKRTLSPAGGDDRAAIQAAIDQVSALRPDANGFRGAVALAAGTFDVSGPLFIRAGGVVLRGAGQGTSGTIIRLTSTVQVDCLQVVGPATSRWTEVAGTRQRITTRYVPTGATSLAIASSAGYAVGDEIVVLRTPNQAWINDLGMDKPRVEWTPESFAIGYERRVTAVSGNTLSIDAPIVQAIENKYGGGEVFRHTAAGRIQKVGVEGIRFDSTFASAEDENKGWSAINFKNVTHGWVRDVTAVHYGYAAVHISDNSRNITVQDCAIKDFVSMVAGGRRYSFAISGNSSLNLFQRCYSRTGRHDYVTGSRVPGPNVFLDSVAPASRQEEQGPHHRYATGLLYDNIKCGVARVRDQSISSAPQHGWSGAQTLFWNMEAGREIQIDSPLGAKNYCSGCRAPLRNGAGLYESFGTAVTPRSLYLQQLRDRLGAAAVNAVTSSAQRSGTVWEQLTSWAGEGRSPVAAPAAGATP